MLVEKTLTELLHDNYDKLRSLIKQQLQKFMKCCRLSLVKALWPPLTHHSYLPTWDVELILEPKTTVSQQNYLATSMNQTLLY